MIDIDNITALINALRAETQANSISPDSLGALLQAIANLLNTAASSTELQTKTNQIKDRLDYFTVEQNPQPIETWRDEVNEAIAQLQSAVQSVSLTNNENAYNGDQDARE